MLNFRLRFSSGYP